jgi:hypothetical protein
MPASELRKIATVFVEGNSRDKKYDLTVPR